MDAQNKQITVPAETAYPMQNISMNVEAASAPQPEEKSEGFFSILRLRGGGCVKDCLEAICCCCAIEEICCCCALDECCC